MTSISHTKPVSTPSRVGIGTISPYLLLLIICLPLLLIRLTEYPLPWHDEGYSIQVSQTLLEQGIYGTYNYGDGYRPFDPTVSSGPTVILPMALSLKVFGTGYFAARILTVVYGLIALFAFCALTAHLFGRQVALFATLLMFAFPVPVAVRFFTAARQMLGEVPGLAFLLPGLLLWFRSWENRKWSYTLGAGLLLGLAIVTKPQLVFAAGPAFGLVVLVRSVLDRKNIVKYFAPVVLMVGVVGVWTLIQRLGTTDAIRAESGALLAEAFRLHFFTGLWGRNLNTTGMILTALMGLAVLVSGWKFASQARAGKIDNAMWGEATLALFIAVTAVWFALLSVSFERYAFFGVTLSILLLSKPAFDLIVKIGQTLFKQNVIGKNIAVIASAGALLVLVAVAGYELYSNRSAANDAQLMADYIDANVPSDAVIESQEVEINAISAHLNFHRPGYQVMYTAIQQYAHEQRAFDLSYDMLQANPDYIIDGDTSIWLGLYDKETLANDFEQIAAYGPYVLYQRKGS